VLCPRYNLRPAASSILIVSLRRTQIEMAGHSRTPTALLLLPVFQTNSLFCGFRRSRPCIPKGSRPTGSILMITPGLFERAPLHHAADIAKHVFWGGETRPGDWTDWLERAGCCIEVNSVGFATFRSLAAISPGRCHVSNVSRRHRDPAILINVVIYQSKPFWPFVEVANEEAASRQKDDGIGIESRLCAASFTAGSSLRR
jgi:hypothetical protein